MWEDKYEFHLFDLYSLIGIIVDLYRWHYFFNCCSEDIRGDMRMRSTINKVLIVGILLLAQPLLTAYAAAEELPEFLYSKGGVIYPIIVIAMFLALTLLVESNKQHMSALIIEYHMPAMPVSRIEFLSKKNWYFLANESPSDCHFKRV
jgi:hypothetical protein